MDLNQIDPNAPSGDGGSQLGPNEFESRFEVQAALENQAAASMLENGQPTEVGAPEGSQAQGVTESNDSFLNESEQAQFDTNSPEYKAMHASFTRKMQELSEREASLNTQTSLVEQRLNSIEAQLTGQHQSEQPQTGVNWDDFRPPQLSEELAPYQDELLSFVREVGTHMVSQLEAQASQQQQVAQQTEFQTKLQGEVATLRSGPDAADFNRHYQAVYDVAAENPNLITRVGIKGILDMVRGYSSAPAQQAPAQVPGYGNGVEDTLARMQSRKTSAVDNIQPMGAPAAGPPQGIPLGTSIENAVEMAFNQARRAAGG